LCLLVEDQVEDSYKQAQCLLPPPNHYCLPAPNPADQCQKLNPEPDRIRTRIPKLIHPPFLPFHQVKSLDECQQLCSDTTSCRFVMWTNRYRGYCYLVPHCPTNSKVNTNLSLYRRNPVCTPMGGADIPGQNGDDTACQGWVCY